MRLKVPEVSLVVLIGASGSGKSTFAARHFLPTEVLSSDTMRAWVRDDEGDQSATRDAFDVLRYVADKRLAAMRLTVVDATNVQHEARQPLVALAREHDVLAVAVVFDLPEKVCRERNRARPDRQFGRHVLRQQTGQLRRSVRRLQREGFRYVHVLRSEEDIEAVEIERTRLWTDRREETGPFDIVGDVHGCFDELRELMERLGWTFEGDGDLARHPEGRKLVLLGDLVDRGPGVARVLRLAMNMVDEGTAVCVPGNHDVKLLRWLRGKNPKPTHGLQESIDQLEAESQEFRDRATEFLDALVSHFVLDGGRLVVAHAGMKECYQRRASGRVRQFALYGDTTGETDEFGLPVRYPWAEEYRGRATVVYGHTPVPEAEWLNGTINVDTGCVFGGKLTALRWPEREIESVPARRVYVESLRPLEPSPAESLTAQQVHDDLLHLEDVTGKRIVSTSLQRSVTIREEHGRAALEVFSRFTADPKWIVYLPPTMAPVETSRREGLLEHPDGAFDHYARHGVESVVCEEKHMGSRAVIVLGRDEDAVRERFGIRDEGIGAILTRTGRPFFPDEETGPALLDRIRDALTGSGFWDRFETTWAVIDAEIMPWSAKAQGLLRGQYAPVAAAADAGLSAAVRELERATSRVDASGLLERYRVRAERTRRYRESYRRYCWSVTGLEDYRVAPFHLLATEGRVHVDRGHVWHMETLAEVCARDDLLLATAWREVDLSSEESRAAGVAWWEELTASGGEGMVVKPAAFVARGKKGLLQPALKVRGREYLRIIYGPEYTAPEHLERLRQRGLSRKRSLALREFALGIEALERFVRREPLRRIHECCFGVLALESDPVDPRL